jgi:tetratricopeptide (TPR) repeat protein
VSIESLDAKTQYESGKQAFERGQYRQSVEYLEKAVNLEGRNSQLGGEMQLWLISAYQAAGQQREAIALCEQLDKHPDLQTRKQSRRLLYILKAPKLQPRPEWLTQIPDLAKLEDSNGDNKASFRTPPAKSAARPRSEPEAEPIDLSQVNTKDNRFIWVALVGIILLVGGLLWFS